MKSLKNIKWMSGDNMKKKIVLIGIGAIVVIGCIAFALLQRQSPKKMDESLFYDALCYKIESAQKEEDVFVTRVDGFSTIHLFDSISNNLVVTDDPFEGDWIYKITFNGNDYCSSCEEVVVLVNETSMSVNGENYVPNDEQDADYMDYILERLLIQYDYYYEHSE